MHLDIRYMSDCSLRVWQNACLELYSVTCHRKLLYAWPLPPSIGQRIVLLGNGALPCLRSPVAAAASIAVGAYASSMAGVCGRAIAVLVASLEC
jgi:hypothetical protein